MVVPRAWEFMLGEAWMGRQEGGIWTDSKQEVLSMVSWDSGQLFAPGAWGCSFGKDREIDFVAKCNLETTLSVCPLLFCRKHD